MIAAPTKTLLTVDEFWDFVNLHENRDRRFELRRGEVLEMSRGTWQHGRVCFRIGYLFERFFELHPHIPGIVIGNDSGVVLDEVAATVVGPDVMVILGPPSFESVHRKWGDRVPVFVAEVLSPNDRWAEVNEKVEDYLAAGVRLVWVADYENRRVTVFAPGAAPQTRADGEELSGGEVLPGFACKLADLFRIPGENPQP